MRNYDMNQLKKHQKTMKNKKSFKDNRWERQKKNSTEIQMMKKIFLAQNKVKQPRKLSRKKYNVL